MAAPILISNPIGAFVDEESKYDPVETTAKQDDYNIPYDIPNVVLNHAVPGSSPNGEVCTSCCINDQSLHPY